jgi:hypothetical protein
VGEEMKPAFMFACDLAAASFLVKGLQEKIVQKEQYCNKWNLKCKLRSPEVTLFKQKPENRERRHVYC